LSGSKALLKSSVLGLTGLINEKSAEQPGACTRSGSESSISTDGPGDGSYASARRGAGQCALLGRGHIGAGRSQDSGSCKQY